MLLDWKSETQMFLDTIVYMMVKFIALGVFGNEFFIALSLVRAYVHKLFDHRVIALHHSHWDIFHTTNLRR